MVLWKYCSTLGYIKDTFLEVQTNQISQLKLVSPIETTYNDTKLNCQWPNSVKNILI